MLAACGSSSPSTSGPAVSAVDIAFTPAVLHIKAVETVTLVNNGQTSHTVTAGDNSYHSGLGFYMYVLSLSLYAVWLSIATWDLVRRSDIKSGVRIGWLAIVYLIPILGPLAYYLFGRSEIPRSARFTIAFGIPITFLAISVLHLFTIS